MELLYATHLFSKKKMFDPLEIPEFTTLFLVSVDDIRLAPFFISHILSLACRPAICLSVTSYDRYFQTFT